MSRTEDEIRMCHMLDAGRKAIEFTRGCERDDLDKDEKLAAEIVKRITERIAGRVSDESHTAESRT